MIFQEFSENFLWLGWRRESPQQRLAIALFLVIIRWCSTDVYLGSVMMKKHKSSRESLKICIFFWNLNGFETANFRESKALVQTLVDAQMISEGVLCIPPHACLLEKFQPLHICSSPSHGRELTYVHTS